MTQLGGVRLHERQGSARAAGRTREPVPPPDQPEAAISLPRVYPRLASSTARPLPAQKPADDVQQGGGQVLGVMQDHVAGAAEDAREMDARDRCEAQDNASPIAADNECGRADRRVMRAAPPGG